MKKFLWVLLIIIIILLILFLLCRAGVLPFCKKEPASWETYIKPNPDYTRGDTLQQILVLRTNDDPTYFNSWLDSIHSHCGDFDITVFCGTCDSTLMLLSGNGIRTFIQNQGGGKGGGTACQGTTKCPPTGGGDTIYWCVNFPINLNYATINDTIRIPGQNPDYNRQVSPPVIIPPAFTDTAVTVAVFDTGIDPGELSSYLYSSSIPSCLDAQARNGWNFPARTNNTTDDYNQPYGHGEIVSRLIVEQVNHYGMNGVKILPVKIHNQNGESDLFSILCGFSYAAERGAKIINASFGYYALKSNSGGLDDDALLIKQYIKRNLTDNRILLIAAAGNRNIADNDASEKALFTQAGLSVPADKDLRNLDTINFYPASLASDPDLPNVIAVTTAFEPLDSVSPNQNYSQNVVDIGVNADVNAAGDFWFINTKHPERLIKGSSYAAPIVTGIICSHYSSIINNIPANTLNKENIIDYLLKPAVGVGHVNTLHSKIKKGVFLKN